MALTTLAENKAYLGITNGSKDTLIEIIRPAVEEQIIAYCDTNFEEKTVTKEMHDGIESDVIVPYNFPVIQITAVYIGCDVNGENGRLLEADEYYVDDDGSVILRSSTTPFLRGNVRLDYKHGYTSVPSTIKLCVYQTVKAELQRQQRNTEDISSRSKEGESESYGSAWDSKSGLPKQILGKLDPYKAREIPLAGMAQRNK